MVEWIQRRILTWMRVPPEPQTPEGSAGSVRVFRSGRNFYKWRIMIWSIANVGVLAALAFGFVPLLRPVRLLPHGAQLIWQALELSAFAGFIASLPFTFLQQRLNFQLRWY